MAKTISDEKMKLEITINGDSAKTELFQLEKQTRSLNEQNKENVRQRKLLETQGKKDTEQYRILTATIKSNTAEILANKNRMSELQKEIGLTGLTMGQLQSKALMLRNTLRNLVPGSEDYKKYNAELTQVNTRLGELSGRSRTAQTSIGSMADTFNRYQGMAIAAIGALTGVVLSIQKIIDINGKLSDAQSDVMKTTGMTKLEVDELTKSFGLLQTRTSRIDLLGIAEQGGRIGIAKAEIGDFVNVMNKASVSLGDSFTGGAEEVANKLGKIKFLFQETKDLNVEQAYNSIGSAINDLGANGVASEANIADFTTRIGSLTDVLKPTIQQTLALGTAFEESGIESEVSARAYGIFMKQASTETAKFAKVMNLTQGEVESMINTNPLEFMLQFAQGMKGMNATDTAKTLDALGISADGANKVIGAMGNNTARFRELIDLSNNSFASGTSLINEYNIKNNNLAATLEKISKTVSGWFSSETFIKWLTAAVSVLGKMIGVTDDANGSISSLADKLMFFVKTIALILVSLFNYQVGLKLAALWTTKVGTATAWSNLVMNIQYGLLVIQEVATKALAFAQSFLTLKLSEVRKAFVALTASMNLNPYAALIGIVLSVVAAYAIFKDSAEETSKVFENQVLINNKVTEQLSDHKQKVSDLIGIMKDENATIEQKKEALSQLQKIAGGYLDTLTQENIATDEGTRLIRRYIKAIDELASAQAIQDVKAELRKEKLKQDNKVLALSQEKTATKNEGSSLAGDDGKWFGMGSRNKMEIQLEIDTEKKKAEDLGFQITALENTKTRAVTELQTAIRIRNEKLKKAKKDSQQFKELTQSIKNDEKALNILIGLESTKEETPGLKFNPLDNTDKGTGTKKNPNSSLAEINRRKIEEAQKTNDELLALDQQLQDDKLSVMEAGAAKELILEQERYLREIKVLESKKVHTDELAKLDEDLAKAKEDGNKSEYARLFALKEGWNAKNKVYDDKINLIIEGKLDIHNKKLALITEKAGKELIDKEHENYERSKINRETAFNNELNSKVRTEEEKKKLTEEFNNNELLLDKEYLIKKLDELNRIIDGEVINGIDFSLLSPEAKEEIIKNTELVKNAVSKIKEASAVSDGTKETDLGIGKGEVDVLGFSQDQWNKFFTNIDNGTIGLQTMTMAIMAATQVFAQMDQLMTASENAKISRETKTTNDEKVKLKKKLDSKLISQKQYDKQVAKLDADLEEKKIDVEIKQAKRQKMLSVASIATNTALGIMQIWGHSPDPTGISQGVMTAIIAGLGAIQLATVLAQPLPAKGHEAGLYPEYVKRSQDGKVFQSKYQGKTRSGLVSDTSHFLVAENGPEMVIDNKAWRQMNPEVKDALIRELNGIKGFEKGLYNQDKMRYEVPAASGSSSSDTQMLQMMMALVAENTATMKELKEKVFIGVMTNKDLKSMGYLQEGIDAANELREKSKR